MLRYYYSLKRFVRDYLDYKWFKWAYQRMRYGFSARQLWSLDHTITDFILPRLKSFRYGGGNSHLNGPSGSPMLEGYEEYQHEEMYQEWLSILDKMILAFEYHKMDMDDVDSGVGIDEINIKDNKVSTIKDENKWQTYLKEEERRQKIIEEGLMLFAKYYRSLWD